VCVKVSEVKSVAARHHQIRPTKPRAMVSDGRDEALTHSGVASVVSNRKLNIVSFLLGTKGKIEAIARLRVNDE
jgi:hypothetical protein